MTANLEQICFFGKERRSTRSRASSKEMTGGICFGEMGGARASRVPDKERGRGHVVT